MTTQRRLFSQKKLFLDPFVCKAFRTPTKKTKRQKLEEIIYNPIICIGNDKEDKKIKEIKSIVPHFQLESPTNNELHSILSDHYNINNKMINTMVHNSQNDLRKLHQYIEIYNLYNMKDQTNKSKYINVLKTPNCESKDITKQLLMKSIKLYEHKTFINENERTIIALLLHENVIKIMQHTKNNSMFHTLYRKILDYFCFSDYIDRITFQKQIWDFNEITSILKSCYSSKCLHDFFREKSLKIKLNDEIIFTKILTKYSNEFNNLSLINNLCSILHITKVICFVFLVGSNHLMNV